MRQLHTQLRVRAERLCLLERRQPGRRLVLPEARRIERNAHRGSGDLGGDGEDRRARIHEALIEAERNGDFIDDLQALLRGR